MSSKNLALEIEGLGKRYLISQQEKHNYLGDALMSKLKNPFAKPQKDEFWALRDVSFQVEKGDVLGVIGRNGAGKSTLLKILSQIAEPTEGEIRLYGRVGSLLEVGTGFHPELTGRENIYLNGTILGMRKGEIDRHFDDIVEFAEVARFLDTPVKRYSSGMYVRLAFAVAAHLNPEILVVDEVLAVGDAQFQQKCLGKMQDVSKEEGRTVLFVSHNMAAVRTLCTKAALLKNGQLEYFGDVGEAVSRYSEARASANTIVKHAEVYNQGIVVDDILCNGSDATELQLSPDNTTLSIVVHGSAMMRLRARLGLTITDPDGLPLAHYGEGLDDGISPLVEAGPFEWRAEIELPRNMNEGQYLVTLGFAHHNVQPWVSFNDAITIHYQGVPTGTGDPLRYSDKFGFLMLKGTVTRDVVTNLLGHSDRR